jgi:hypothetical protein
MRAFVQLPTGSDVVDEGIMMLWSDTDEVGVRFATDRGLAVYRRGNPALGPFAAAFSRDQWHCLELYLKADPSLGEVTVRFDDQIVFAQTGVSTVTANGLYDTIFVGVVGTLDTQTDTTSLYTDEFVLSATGPIGCH